MELWLPALTLIGIYALAVISPGPNFLVITRSALAYSRRTGLQTALGVVTGSFFWLIFGFFGVAIVFSQLPLLFTGLRILGTVYLVYAAFKLLRAELGSRQFAGRGTAADLNRPSRGQAYRHGLLTQMSNPKAALFILALFSSTFSPTTPFAARLVMITIMTVISLFWYLTVAAIFSSSGIRPAYDRFQRLVNLAFAALLLFLAFKILFSA